MNSYLLQVSSTKTEPPHAYTFFSLPLPRGKFRANVKAGIQVEGDPVTAQTWPLAFWPDGSIRMLQGVGPLSGGSYPVEITSTEEAAETDGLRMVREANGDLQVINRQETIRFPNDAFFSDRFDLSVKVIWADGESGRMELEKNCVIRRQGPFYGQVERWVKVSAGARHLRFRFQFEFFWGVPGTAVNVLLVHDCPGEIFQEIRAIHIRVRQADSQPVVYQQYHGFEYLGNRFVEIQQPADVRVDRSNFLPYVRNHEVLRDENTYPHYLRPPANRTGNAVFLKSGTGVLQMEMEDFHLLRPKGIFMESGGATFALWPEWAEPLRLQQGKRRQVRLALYWGHETIPENWSVVQAASSALLDLRRAQLPSEAYAEAEFFDQSRVLGFRPDKYPRFEGWLQALAKIRTVADFFHLGDTKDTHYQTGYIALDYSKRRLLRDAARPDIYTTSGRDALCFENLDEYEPIWVNNEYDVLFALGTEYLRSGNLLLYRQLRWFARHTVEVDFLCHSDHPVHHRAQPAHSENHTSTGAYPSHFWTQGLTQYYFLSGDEDALEVIRALADKTIWYFEHPQLGGLHSGVNREMGWAVLTLVSAYEATGDARYDHFARKLIDAVIAEPLPEDLPNFNFGHTSLLLGCRAYLQVHHHSEACRPVWQWYLQVLDLAIHSSRAAPQTSEKLVLKLSYDYELAERGEVYRQKPRSGVLAGFAAQDCLAYAYERTGNPDYLKAGIPALQAFLDGNPGYYHATTFSSFQNPIPEGKPFAVSYRSWINYLGALDRRGWLKHFDYQAPDFDEESTKH